MTEPAVTAASCGLVRCHSCTKLSRWRAFPPGAEPRCPRCGGRLESRKAGSLTRCWALVLAAYAFYLPANLYPVMIVSRLGNAEHDTILSGVMAMFAAGWYEVGALIFFASITVPILKLLVMTGLLLSVQRKSSKNLRTRSVLYRIVEVIGRWSMLDMFVVSLSVALIQLGEAAQVEPGIGATFFAAVVVLTIFAASSFDPRLIWDTTQEVR